MTEDAFYEHCVRPLLFALDPEDAHALAHNALHVAGKLLPPASYRYEPNDLQIEFCGKTLANPVGLAAGFDKNATLTGQLAALGFGFAEIGSITALASNGNPRPRLFRLAADHALINRLGLNGEGAQAVAQRLRSSRFSLPIGVNIAKTHDPDIKGHKAVEDILRSFEAIKDLNLLYVAFNASCPNTREGCMEEKEQLLTVLTEIQKINARALPLFIKVSPDSSDQLVEDIVEIGHNVKLAGYICGNTTLKRDGLKTDPAAISRAGHGGLSGPPLKPLALDIVRKIARLKTPLQSIVGVGGISTGDDAYEFITSGATAIQLYTGLIYRGPAAAKMICSELSAVLKKSGLTLKAAVGVDLKK
jgi:dihydroorotate dehydrogenase